MSQGIGVDPSTGSLLTAIGITDGNGQFQESWFSDPLGEIGQILSNPVQRAALLRLLDELLPPDPARPGWHPLLDHEYCNVYLTVDEDVIGVAAALHSGPIGSGIGEVSGSVRLPLVDVSGDLRPIAGTPEGPVLIGVDLEFIDADLPLTGAGASISVDIDKGVGAVITVRGVQFGDADPVDLVINSGTVGSDLVTALQLLLKETVDALAAAAGADQRLVRLADHLFALLGIEPATGIPALPLEKLINRPQAMIDWLIDIVDTPGTLTAWATQLAGLIGDDLDPTGSGTADDPVRAELLDSDVVDLDLIITVTDNRELEIGLDARVDAGVAAMSAVATVLRIPLPALPGQPTDPAAAGRRTELVPDIRVGLVAPTSGNLIDNAPGLQVETVGAGFRLSGGALRPWLTVTDVIIDDDPHGVVDLTDADAVIGLAADAATDLLQHAFGDTTPIAQALLTLLGLRKPADAPVSWPLLDLVKFGRGPTAALATLHREILAGGSGSWSLMFAQVGAVVGLDTGGTGNLTGSVTGAGTADDPWLLPIAATGPVNLALAAWNARTATDPDGLQRLRVGFLAEATEGVAGAGLLVELLGIDLPATGAGAVTLIGRTRLAVAITPEQPLELPGLQLVTGPLNGQVSWRPGEPPVWQVGVTGVVFTVDGTDYGPYALTLPGAGAPADLGLGDDAILALGLLLSSALRSWAGETAYAIAAGLGLHRDLAGLPDDWPLLADVLTEADSFASLLADPAAALRSYLLRVVTGVSADGSTYVTSLLQLLGRLLPGDLTGVLGGSSGGAPALAGVPSGSFAGQIDGIGATRPISGGGSYDDPWTITVIDRTADPDQGITGVELLAWLDPAGPPAEWIAGIAQLADSVTDGALLTDLLSAATGFLPRLGSLLGGRGTAVLGEAFTDLADWLTAGDGLVPLPSQLPDGWDRGDVVATPHGMLPKDPQVITQISTRLGAGTGPVLLISPPFADHTIWSELITALTGTAQPDGTRIDLRALPDPSEVNLTRISTVAGVYTVDLFADQALSEVDQLHRVVDRIHTITGQPVRVVGHSTAGVVARTWAAAHPELVTDLITLGSPHAGSDLAPLTDAALADAVRVGAAVAGPIADSALGGTMIQLAGLLDGAGGALGAAIRPEWFSGVAGGIVDPRPGLAIGSRLTGDLTGLLAGAAVTGLAAAGDPPTHLAFGVRIRLATPQAGYDNIAVTADARIDVARLRLAAGADEPARPATAISLDSTLFRDSGWLVGDGLLPTGPVTARVRRVEAGVTISSPGNTGALVVRPRLRLVDATVEAGRLAADLGLGDQALQAALDAVAGELTAAAGPVAAPALQLLRAAGVVIDSTGGPIASIRGLADLATVPLQTLAYRRDQLLAAIRRLLGLPAGPLQVSLAELPLRLTLDDSTLIARLETSSDIALAGTLATWFRLDIETRTMTVTLDARLDAGPLTLHRAADGNISVGAGSWLPELTLRPYDPSTLEGRLTGLVADLSVSAVTSALLAGLGTGPITVPPISALVRDPVGWLTGPDALGNAAGQLDGSKINNLLQTIAGALSMNDSQGLGLPGDFVITAAGSDPLQLRISGTVGEDADQLGATIGLGIDLSPAGTITPSGAVTLKIALDGLWGDLTVAFTTDAEGIGLVITPENVAPIRLLPTTSGLGDLLGDSATALVPKVLQEIVDNVAAPHPVLDIVLQIAAELGVYEPAPGAGFTGTAQAQRLRSMLDPDWLLGQVSDPAAIMDLIAGLFPSTTAATGIIPLPAGHRVTRTGNRLRWESDLLPGCRLGVELGWAAAGHPQVLVTLDGLDTGPVTIVSARLGYLDDFEGLVRARLDVGDPLAFFTPELEFSLAGVQPALRVLPLGESADTDAEIVLLPTPAVTLTAAGGVQLAGDWLLPLLIRYVLPEVEALIAEPLWTGGPSPRKILFDAGLVTSETGDLQLPATFPSLPAIALQALKSALSGVTIDLPDGPTLKARTDSGRFGLQLQGSVSIPGDDVSVTVLFGQQDWIGADAGVTAWLISDAPGEQIPITPDPGLDLVGLGLRITGTDAKPLVGGTGDDSGPVRLGGLGAMIFVDLDLWDSGQATFAVDNLGAAVELIDAAVQVDSSDADSFVSKIIPKELAAGFSVAIAYRNDQLEVHGGPGDLDNGVALTFPLDLNLLDVIFLRELYLAAMFGQGRTDVVAALSGNAKLGPVAVNVTRVGLRVLISSSGAVLSFKPPDGFGLSLDTSTIRLGGFLLVDEARGRYVGALEIAVLKKFQLTAIGIVTTKHPDGTPGFSLLMLVTVTLPVPIPLGYGFFFSGAGGLLGLNRGMDVDRIRTGLRTGTADSILFPTDIVNRIDVIVRDLEESFPQADGHFLIAPVGMIQWMNPALVTLKVGILLEIAPQPNFALLGVLRLALPTAEDAVVDLKVAFLGGIDVGAGLLYFDAAIYDSFIGYDDFKLSLEGDIAIRLSWGSKPDLVASVGGFHPSYRPAANLKLPAMRRITLSLLKDNPRLTLRLYFAVTSNTIQFGAALEFFAGVDGFSISGDLGFDVLVQFVPFLIDAHMWGRLAVTAGSTDVCSISLDLQLRGPTPWYAHGTASISILFFSISVDVEATFGTAHETSIPGQPVLPRVLDQLADPMNWVAELSAVASAGVSLLPLPANALVVDAAGLLSARQNLIPLETDIGLVGKTPPSDVRQVRISTLTFGTGAAAEQVRFDDLTAAFSPSTFAGAPTKDTDLLKAPAFEQRPNGVRAADGEELQAGAALRHEQTYEMIVIDDPDADAPGPVPGNPQLAFSTLVSGGAIGASAAARRRRTQAERGTVVAATASEPLYAVTTTADLTGLDAHGSPATGQSVLLTRTEAEQRLAALSAVDTRRYQIVPEAQVVR